MIDFTLQQYERLCLSLVKAGYTSIGMSDYLRNTPHDDSQVVLLRHDVDSRALHSLKLASIEHTHQIKATYFHRMIPSVYSPRAITATAQMGHEIGYHYETLAIANGDMAQAIALFEQDLAVLRQLVPITIASMHGSPLKKWDNRAIWQDVSPQSMGLLGEAYRDFDYNKIQYYNDTGRTWNPHRYNLRDKTSHAPRIIIDSTDELIRLIQSRQLKHLCISTHPERWHNMSLAWLQQNIRDTAINAFKVILKRLYRL